MDRLERLGAWTLSVFGEIGVSGLIDIAVMTFVIHAILVWLRRTKRAAAVLTGMLIVAGFYLLARQFDLHLTAAVLQGFFAVILVALVVIFQEELRYLFERVAQWSLHGRRLLAVRQSKGPLGERIGLLVRTATDLARQACGAIIVLRGVDPVSRHLQGGQPLNGELSEAILKSVFDPHSMGHDGAMIVEGDMIREFGCHLPLSKNLAEIRRRGTRHAAALGLAERTDALCLVVSEETGAVSIARHGKLQELSGSQELTQVLADFYREIGATEQERPATAWRGHPREKLISLVLAAALWFVLVHEARVEYRTYHLPVEFGQAPANLTVAEWQPEELAVTFSAPKKSFYFTRKRDVRSVVKVWGLDAGASTVALGSADFVFPDGLAFESVRPRQITVRLDTDHPAGR